MSVYLRPTDRQGMLRAYVGPSSLIITLIRQRLQCNVKMSIGVLTSRAIFTMLIRPTAVVYEHLYMYKVKQINIQPTGSAYNDLYHTNSDFITHNTMENLRHRGMRRRTVAITSPVIARTHCRASRVHARILSTRPSRKRRIDALSYVDTRQWCTLTNN